MELKQMDYLDIMQELVEQHPDITKLTLADITNTVIRWKEARKSRFK